MKRIASGAFLLLFLLLLLSGSVSMLFHREDGAKEKRVLASFPSLSEGTDLPARFEDWLNDHIGLRTFWTGRYARISALLGSSVEENVIIGTEGRLYFTPTLADYTGVGAPDENDCFRIRLLLDTIRRAAGRPFLVLIAPNKNSAVPQYMPAAYPRTEEPHTAARLMKNSDVPVLYPLDELSDETLWYRTDTHWNAKGARIAAALLTERLNGMLGTDAVSPDPEAEYRAEDYDGDLGTMLFPSDPPEDSRIVYEDGAADRFRYKGHFLTEEDLKITTSGNGTEAKLLILRDSFSNLLLEPLSAAWSDVTYRRAVPLPLSDAGSFDAIVLEIAERRLGELLKSCPVINAPEAEPFEEDPNCLSTVFCREENGGVLVYGTLSGTAERITSLRVRIGETTYEAFPVRIDEGSEGEPFALRIGSLPGDAAVTVLAEGDTILCSESAAVTPVKEE